MELRKRRLKSSSRSSARRWRISSAVLSRIELAFTWDTLVPSKLVPHHEPRANRKLGRAELERLLCHDSRDPFDFEQHASRLDHRDPELGRALALAHSGLGWLLRHRL